MLILIQAIALAVFPLLITSFINNKYLRMVLAFLMAGFVCLEFASLYLSGEFINYQFFTHMSVESLLSFAFQFTVQISLFVLVFVILSVAYFISHDLSAKITVSVRCSALAVSFILLFVGQGAFQQVYQIYKTTHAEQKQFHQALQDLNINPEEFIRSDQIEALAGKNIIVLSLESFEQGFLNPPYKKYTPNLNRLKKDWTFFNNFNQSPGSEWTAGSIYATQVGAPAFFNQHHLQSNELFQNSSRSLLPGLGNVLKQAGYSSKYIIGKPEFAGMESMIELFDIEVVSEKNSRKKYPASPAGLQDMDLFNELKQQIELHVQSSDKPFAMFASTINTHFPEGIFDKRMMQYVGNINEPLLYSIAATDHLIGDLIRYLEGQNLLENTVLFIFPDHQLMGTSGPIIRELKKKPRKLFFLTNAQADSFTNDTSGKFFQADAPRLIVEGAEIKSNVKFLRDHLQVENFNTYLRENKDNLASLNNASLKRNNFNQGIEIEVEDEMLLISSASQTIELRLNSMLQKELYQLVFNQDMVELETSKVSDFDDSNSDLSHIYLNISVQGGQIVSSSLGNMLGPSLERSRDFSYNRQEISTLMEQTSAENQKLKEKRSRSGKEFLASYAKNPMRYIAHAGGEVSGHKYTNSLQALDQSYAIGFRLFELDIIETQDGHLVAAHDWQTWRTITDFPFDHTPTLEEFLRFKIHDEFTPLDMNVINQWFQQHPDAILVTDKIDDPQRLVNEFTDRNRLMMELFSWESVEVASQLNIRSVMPTGELLLNYPFQIVSKLRSLNINEVVMSRRWADKSALVSLLKEEGFKIYAFHINFDKGIDETYVTCNESHLYHGMYADKWDFSKPVSCDSDSK